MSFQKFSIFVLIPLSCFICSLGATEAAVEAQKVQQISREPSWAEGDPDKVSEYYTLHEESTLDRLLSGIACSFGPTVRTILGYFDVS